MATVSPCNGFAPPKVIANPPFNTRKPLVLHQSSAAAGGVVPMRVILRRRKLSIITLSQDNSSSSSSSSSVASEVEAATPETVTKVVDIVARQLGTSMETVHPGSRFQELGADSLDQVEIVMALEEEFDIHVSENGAGSISTVQDAANLIQAAIFEKSR